MSNEFFPSIGSVAQKTDDLPEEEEVALSVDQTEGAEEERPLQEVESLCMNCGEQGITRMLLTSIPYFKEVIVMSFLCTHCGNRNNEIQPAGTIRDKGTVFTTKVVTREDLDRQIVKSHTCTVVIQEWELTLPPSRGQLTTVEGLIRDIASDLSADQPLRRIENEDAYKKIQVIIDAFREIILDTDGEDEDPSKPKPQKEDKVTHPFTIRLDDPSGNSWVEFLGSMADPKWNMRQYARTNAQNTYLGIAKPDDKEGGGKEESTDDDDDDEPLEESEEILIFPGICSSCGHSLDTMMKRVTIPYFKEVLIMSTNCDRCGYRDNEVKSGTAISSQGKRITLKVEGKEDLSRDILKSETCGLSIPEISLVLQGGTLGGRFTTIEGILDQVYDELNEKVYMTGDSTDPDSAFTTFLAKLKRVKSAEIPFTLILDDPLANSFLQNIYAPDPDPDMTVEVYDRTFEQNEELGLNDIKVENYTGDSKEPVPVSHSHHALIGLSNK